MTNCLIISGHFADKGRKVDLHFMADELVRQGIDVNYLTVGISPITKFKGDSRWRDALPQKNHYQKIADHVGAYVWVAPVHPFNLRHPLPNALAAPLFSLYPWLLPRNAHEMISQSKVVIFDSGLPPVLINKVRQINDSAAFVYNAADRQLTNKVHPVVSAAEKNGIDQFMRIRVPAKVMIEDFPATAPVEFIPHGLEKSEFERENPNPYKTGKNAINIGDMLFDKKAIETLAKEAPDWTIHLFGRGAKLDEPMPNVIEYGERPFDDIVPYIQHADIGLAPYRDAPLAEYLSQSSLKIIQYTSCQLPVVAPDFAAADRAHVCAYRPDNSGSLLSAFARAKAYDRSTINSDNVLSWREVMDRFLDGLL